MAPFDSCVVALTCGDFFLIAQEPAKPAAKPEASFTFHGKQPKAAPFPNVPQHSHYDKNYLLLQLNREDQDEGGSIENLNLALRVVRSPYSLTSALAPFAALTLPLSSL
jgi:hypothetical protein